MKTDQTAMHMAEKDKNNDASERLERCCENAKQSDGIIDSDDE